MYTTIGLTWLGTTIVHLRQFEHGFKDLVWEDDTIVGGTGDRKRCEGGGREKQRQERPQGFYSVNGALPLRLLCALEVKWTDKVPVHTLGTLIGWPARQQAQSSTSHVTFSWGHEPAAKIHMYRTYFTPPTNSLLKIGGGSLPNFSLLVCLAKPAPAPRGRISAYDGDGCCMAWHGVAWHGILQVRLTTYIDPLLSLFRCLLLPLLSLPLVASPLLSSPLLSSPLLSSPPLSEPIGLSPSAVIMSVVVIAIVCPIVGVLLVAVGCGFWSCSSYRRRMKRFEDSGLPAKIRKSGPHDTLEAALGRDFGDRVQKSTAHVLASHKRSELQGFRGGVWMSHHATAAGVLEHCRIFAHEHMFEIRPRRPDDASKLEAGEPAREALVAVGDSVLEYTSEPRTLGEEGQQRILAAAAAAATASEASNSKSKQGQEQENADAALAAAGLLLVGTPSRPTADGIDALLRTVVGSFDDAQSPQRRKHQWNHLVRQISAAVVDRPNRPNYESVVGSRSTNYRYGTTLVDRAVRANVWASHAEGLRRSTPPSEPAALCAAIAEAKAFAKDMAKQYERAGVDLHLATGFKNDRARHVDYWFIINPPGVGSSLSTTGGGGGGGGGGVSGWHSAFVQHGTGAGLLVAGRPSLRRRSRRLAPARGCLHLGVPSAAWLTDHGGATLVLQDGREDGQFGSRSKHDELVAAPWNLNTHSRRPQNGLHCVQKHGRRSTVKRHRPCSRDHRRTEGKVPPNLLYQVLYWVSRTRDGELWGPQAAGIAPDSEVLGFSLGGDVHVHAHVHLGPAHQPHSLEYASCLCFGGHKLARILPGGAVIVVPSSPGHATTHETTPHKFQLQGLAKW
ncbi:hypothetical protein SODALDRAFT_359756 [Sodiomyces alkalinus F11]|uniref:Uncharacterized protein n=1 Tax=Sodiomyces alkalinus (strain CBS 110278 / VKM F-3762 / F11) TaxID=1314773 RepID=A0A3N2PVZ8_SODAK|nr:hypothetical protein SODALDRAFT_359756 [Sodiomyces alkalinus F11]ROT38652.1 hypothetical protein SODALDRAFT_359756 [Sodiomyces alkalinus F11]